MLDYYLKKKSSWHERGNEHKEREAWSEVRQDHVYPQLEGISAPTGTKMSTGEDGTQLLIGAEGTDRTPTVHGGSWEA